MIGDVHYAGMAPLCVSERTVDVILQVWRFAWHPLRCGGFPNVCSRRYSFDDGTTASSLWMDVTNRHSQELWKSLSFPKKACGYSSACCAPPSNYIKCMKYRAGVEPPLNKLFFGVSEARVILSFLCFLRGLLLYEQAALWTATAH